MPKKRKNGLSPSRAPLNAAEFGSGSESRAHGANGRFVTRPGSSYDSSGSTQFRSGQSESQSRDEIVQSMQEMFSHLDSEVIYMVLSEADFKGKSKRPPLAVILAVLGTDSTQSNKIQYNQRLYLYIFCYYYYCYWFVNGQRWLKISLDPLMTILDHLETSYIYQSPPSPRFTLILNFIIFSVNYYYIFKILEVGRCHDV